MKLSYNWKKLSWIVSFQIALIFILSTLYLPGGADFFNYYLPVARGDWRAGFTPAFSVWFLWPLSLANHPWTVLAVITVCGILFICWLNEVNPLYVLLSFPVFGQIWLGQVDIIPVMALLLAIKSKPWYWRGLGIFVALMKPQITLIAVIVLLIQDKDRLRLIIVPMVGIITSIIVFGFWPLEWLRHAQALPGHTWRLASRQIWFFGLVALPLPFLLKDIKVALLVSSISSKYFSVYSYIAFMILESSPLTLFLSWSWVLAYPLLGISAMKFCWVLPVGLLIKELFSELKPYLVSRKFITNPLVDIMAPFVKTNNKEN